MSEKVKFFHPREWLMASDGSQICDHMSPSEAGAYVQRTDYTRLQVENEQLRRRCDALKDLQDAALHLLLSDRADKQAPVGSSVEHNCKHLTSDWERKWVCKCGKMK